jgi:hypothetical protein
MTFPSASRYAPVTSSWWARHPVLQGRLTSRYLAGSYSLNRFINPGRPRAKEAAET